MLPKWDTRKMFAYQIEQCRNGENADARTGHGGPHLQSRHTHTSAYTRACVCMCAHVCVCECVCVLGGLKQVNNLHREHHASKRKAWKCKMEVEALAHAWALGLINRQA